MYFSLFGHDIKAGQTSRARLRLAVTSAASEQQILELYKKYMDDIANDKI
jgi:hypothetical protein